MLRRPLSPLVAGILVGAALIALAGGIGLAYLFLHASPAAVGVATASSGTSQPAATVAGGSPLPAGALAGTWNVDPSIGSFDYSANDFSGSFVGYRINEQLASIGANTAVGRTPSVTGSLTMDGTRITSVDVSADLRRLQSDDSRRDGVVARLSLGTATFRLTSPIELGSVPADGQTVSATATGGLTIHGVTRSVQIPVQAQLSGDVVTVTGSLGIVFADYGIVAPTSFIAVSVEDHGTIELQLHFRHA